MRHTLLPSVELHKFNHEYRVRLFVVFLFMLSAAGVIGLVALTPAFMRSSIEELQQLRSASSLSQGPDDSKVSLANSQINSAETLATDLESNINGPRLSDLVQAIAAVKDDSAVSSFTLTRSSDTSITALIQGTSPTREALIAFENRLKGAIPGVTVDIPLNELTQDVNVAFSITVTQTLP